jgi:hemerythrin
MNRLTNDDPSPASAYPNGAERRRLSRASADTPVQTGDVSPHPSAPTHSDQPPETPLIWRDDWCMDIPPLDADHRRMVELVNQLLATQMRAEGSAAAGDDSGDALTRFERLVDHLRAHFEREEALMLSIDYADFQNHKCEHSLQLAELTDLRRQIPNVPGAALSRESLQWIKRWCFDHLMAEDRNLARAYADITRP